MSVADLRDLGVLIAWAAIYIAVIAGVCWLVTREGGKPAPRLVPTFDEVLTDHAELDELAELTQDNWLVYFELFPLDTGSNTDE